MIKLPDWLSDVEIYNGAVPGRLGEPIAQGVLWQADRDHFLIEIPGVARYLVSAGTRITIEPAFDAAERDVARFLYMTPLAALLYQRGHLAFHAAAWADAQGAVLLCGDSGAGKSTLLAAGAHQGREVLADELVAVQVDERGRLWLMPIRPGEQEIRLWGSAMEKLFPQNDGSHRSGGLETERLAKGRDDQENNTFSEQVYLPWTSPVLREPLPVKIIFRLSVVNKDRVAVKPITGAEAFQAVGLMTYNSQIADALYDRAVYLRLASAVVNAVPIYALQRPRGLWSIEELLDQIVNIV